MVRNATTGYYRTEYVRVFPIGHNEIKINDSFVVESKSQLYAIYEFIRKYYGPNLIEIQNNAIPLILAVFDASQIMGYTRKIDELDPVLFSLQKIEKGWFYKTGVAYSCNFSFSKDGLFHKI